eukprot:m.16430 g.16430  ORF g.16430 m.16430 type:complete len:61 (-) comp10563_c0_seq2:39-221(-)
MDITRRRMQAIIACCSQLLDPSLQLSDEIKERLAESMLQSCDRSYQQQLLRMMKSVRGDG